MHSTACEKNEIHEEIFSHVIIALRDLQDWIYTFAFLSDINKCWVFNKHAFKGNFYI